MNGQIYIFGDSWGVGEWTDHKVSHKGLEFFLQDLGYKVHNHSRAKGSNLDSINKLNQVAKNINSNDRIFFITTCATRDLKYTDKKSFSDLLIKHNGLPLLVDYLLDACYNKLNQIGINYNLKIHMIGGLTNLDLDIITKYDNLVPIIPSWINLLVGSFNEYQNICNQSKFRILDNPEFIINNIDLNSLEIEFAAKLIEDFHLYQEQNSLVFREEIFKPDGVHPNRLGHQLLYKELVKKLNL